MNENRYNRQDPNHVLSSDVVSPNQSVHSYQLSEINNRGGLLGSSQVQSLAARSAEIYKRGKNLAAAANCERTMIIDFDSSVADNNNCTEKDKSKVLAGNGLRSDQQRGGNVAKSRFGGDSSLIGTIPLKGHFSEKNEVARHRLLFAQINAPEYKLCRDAESKTCEDLLKLVCACPVNPETQAGAPQSHTFAISEKFCIDDGNQTLSVQSNRATHPFVLPKNKTSIRSIECIKPSAMEKYFRNTPRCQDLLTCTTHLHVTTCEPHNFVPGLKFALLNGNSLLRDNLAPKEEETCEILKTLLHGQTPLIEVFDIVDATRFLAAPCAKSAFIEPNSETDATVIDAFAPTGSPLAGIMFKRGAYKSVSIDHFIRAETGDVRYFYSRYQQNEESRCGLAVAYIGCATCPQQLAQFANRIVESSVFSLQAMHGIKEISYSTLQDEYSVEFEDGSIQRTKNLLASGEHYITVSLSRNAMLATQKCPAAKQLYLNRALRGSHFFEIYRDINDSLMLYIHVKKCAKVVPLHINIPPGLYKTEELTRCLAELLNSAVNDMYGDCFCFQVDFTLHPAQGMVAWRNCGINNAPMLSTTNAYEARAFSFIISNQLPNRFAIEFAPQLASLLDFAPTRTRFAHAHGSRAISPILEMQDNKPNETCGYPPLPPCRPQKLRATYCASVDECTGVTTIEQKSLSSLYCGTLRVELVSSLKLALCQAGPENAIELPDNLCKSGKTQCEAKNDEKCETKILKDCDESSEESSSEDEIDEQCECVSYLVFQLPHTQCDPAILPLCPRDIVWLRLGDTAVAACVSRVWRVCSESVQYKVALQYTHQNLYNALKSIDPENEQDTEPAPELLELCMSLEPVGFNLHLNPASTQTLADCDQSSRLVKSSHSAASKWLGFVNAETHSGKVLYTSNSCAQSLLDERLILHVPEINECGRAQPRYSSQSPHDLALTRHYGVLILDRVAGVYKYDNTSDSLNGMIAQDRCSRNGEACAYNSTSAKSKTQTLSFHLLRSDGSTYPTCGDTFIASVELCFAN